MTEFERGQAQCVAEAERLAKNYRTKFCHGESPEETKRCIAIAEGLEMYIRLIKGQPDLRMNLPPPECGYLHPTLNQHCALKKGHNEGEPKIWHQSRHGLGWTQR